MKIVAILLLAVLILHSAIGCTHLAVKQAKEIDEDISSYFTNELLSMNCRAGIADAFILAPDTSADIRIAAQAVGQFADKKHPDYIECYSKAAWVSFMSRGVASKGKKLIGEIFSIGTLVP